MEQHDCTRARTRFWFLLGLTVLVSIILLPSFLQKTAAQTVSTPITRHVVLNHAYRYTKHVWYLNGQQRIGVPYAWGYGDWIDSGLGQGPHDCEPTPRLLQHGVNDGCYTGCNTEAGDDCSGYVTRIWGAPLTVKWNTVGIGGLATIVPCRVGQEQCRNNGNWDARNQDLPKRMRMGDVFNDWINPSRHVVTLYYFDPTNNNQPVYYEETPADSCIARLYAGGWTYLENSGGWWNGTDGYRPQRYPEIRDDIYFPWLSHGWYSWESTVYIRNNNGANLRPGGYILQHTLYQNTGTDQGAIANKTYVRPFTHDIMELPTSILNPGSSYVGGGVATADAGTGAVVYEDIARTHAQAYTGIFPFDSLGMGVSEDTGGTYYLYMPFYMYYNPALYSKIFIMNVSGNATNNVTATYYGDDGRTCTHSGSLPAWAVMIFDVNACQWSGGTPSSTGAVVLTGNRPFAAITHEQRSGISAYNGFSRGAQTLYAPSLMQNFYGWHTRLHIQNIGSGSAAITVNYYDYARRLTPICSDTYSLGHYRHVEINHGADSCILALPSPPTIFSAVITANQPIVAMVDQLNGSGLFASNNALIAAKASLLLPFIRNGTGNWGDAWDVSVTVQNTTGNDGNDVTLWLYDQAGKPCGTIPKTLNAHETYLFYSEFDNVYCNGVRTDFSGSVVVLADYGVAATANLVNGSLYDGAISYSATELKDINTK